MEEYLSSVTITDKAIVGVHRPILTEEERAKRMEAIRKAAADLILACERIEALKKPLASDADQSTMQRA